MILSEGPLLRKANIEFSPCYGVISVGVIQKLGRQEVVVGLSNVYTSEKASVNELSEGWVGGQKTTKICLHKV